MSLSEQDWENLNALIDDELPGEQAEALRQRLESDPELSEALAVLKADRAARVAAFESLAPSSAQAEVFADRVIRAARRSERRSLWDRVAAQGRGFAAAAALIVIGFGVGWLGRGPDEGVNMRVAPPAINAQRTSTPVRVQITDRSGQVLGVQEFDTLDQAQKFINDVRHWQWQQEQLRDTDVVYKADQF